MIDGCYVSELLLENDDILEQMLDVYRTCLNDMTVPRLSTSQCTFVNVHFIYGGISDDAVLLCEAWKLTLLKRMPVPPVHSDEYNT